MAKDKKPNNVHEGHRMRMRFRMERDIEMEAFNEHEMLEFLLYYGIPRKDTNEIAHNLINAFGSFGNVFHASLTDLERVSGISKNTAMLIKAVLPISRAVGISRTKGRKFLYTADDAISHFASYFVNEPREVAYAACLDVAGRIINVTNIGKGGGAHTSIDLPKLIQAVSSTHADKVVLMHNHPSGHLYPSDNDILTTNYAMILLYSFNTKLIDHIIFASNGQYFSFYQNQIIDLLVGKANRFLASDTSSVMHSVGNQIKYYDNGVRLSENEKNMYLESIGDLLSKGIGANEPDNL